MIRLAPASIQARGLYVLASHQGRQRIFVRQTARQPCTQLLTDNPRACRMRVLTRARACIADPVRAPLSCGASSCSGGTSTHMSGRSRQQRRECSGHGQLLEALRTVVNRVECQVACPFRGENRKHFPTDGDGHLSPHFSVISYEPPSFLTYESLGVDKLDAYKAFFIRGHQCRSNY